MSGPGKLVGLFLAAVALSLATAAPALAQPRLTESTPKQDARLGRPPQVVRLCFSEPIARSGSADYTLSLARAGGGTVPLTASPSEDGTCLEARPSWPQQAAGAYTLFWMVRQEQGGQSLSGSLTFTVAPPEPPDVLRLAILTTVSVAGAAAAGLVLTLIRRSIGYEPHRPQAEAESESLVGHH
ncbi:MAG TPA: copper resistance protein CopC [Dehalococcoidia bacterium]|nr:copper resistance protein CopC [Dehalococcoidia bacterium]